MRLTLWALNLGAGATAMLLGMTASVTAQSGSFRATCRNVQTSGPTLSADCEDLNGRYRSSNIAFGQCKGEITNINGTLTCNGATAATAGSSNNGNGQYDRNNGNDQRGGTFGGPRNDGGPGSGYGRNQNDGDRGGPRFDGTGRSDHRGSGEAYDRRGDGGPTISYYGQGYDVAPDENDYWGVESYDDFSADYRHIWASINRARERGSLNPYEARRFSERLQQVQSRADAQQRRGRFDAQDIEYQLSQLRDDMRSARRSNGDGQGSGNYNRR